MYSIGGRFSSVQEFRCFNLSMLPFLELLMAVGDYLAWPIASGHPAHGIAQATAFVTTATMNTIYNEI